MSSAQLEQRHQYLDSLDSELSPAHLAEASAATQASFESFAQPETFSQSNPAELKQQVAARLAEHRARRQRNTQAAPAPGPIPVESPARAAKRAAAARISATVAERYANSETYRSFLAAQAEQAINEAEAAAEVAARNAHAVAAAQLDLLDELDQYKAAQIEPAIPEALIPSVEAANATLNPATQGPGAPSFAAPSRRVGSKKSPQPKDPETKQAEPTRQPAHLTVRLYEPVIASSVPTNQTTSHHPSPLDPHDAEALDDEIAFRQSPVFDAAPLITEIPANLIEFPRQLIAARRARPRLAEGPLRDDADAAEVAAQSPSQLRIFEVEPAQLSSAPAVSSAAPEWTSIMLDAHPHAHSSAAYAGAAYADPITTIQYASPIHYTAEEAAQLYIPLDTPATVAPLQTAPLELRIMASAVDTAIVLATLLAFTAAVTLTIGPIPSLSHLLFGSESLPSLWNSSSATTFAGISAALAQLLPIAAIAAGGFLALTALYQVLFFTFSDATPGMHYARIGLCTFSDENPTRAQMRRRALAFLLSACPLGLGLLWSWIDTDRLGWHDRLSRMYQRSY